MGIRSIFNRPYVAGVIVAVAAVAIICAFWMSRAKTKPANWGVVDGRYYTADEGQTWVVDEWALAPPFEKDGKTWLRIWLFTFDGKTAVPGYLEKFSPEALAEITSN